MKIDEAIKEQEEYLHKLNVDIPYKVRDAMRLGIEGLTQIKHDREFPGYVTTEMLPGETE